MYNQFVTMPPPPPRAFDFKVAPWNREFDILNLCGEEFESKSQFARFCQSALLEQGLQSFGLKS